MKTRQMGAIPPSAILSRKGIARYGGGISHWAAKITVQLHSSLTSESLTGVASSPVGSGYGILYANLGLIAAEIKP